MTHDASVIKAVAITVLVFFCSPLTARADGPLPVKPASNQEAFLKSNDPELNFNKKLVYDFWRVVLIGRHLDEAPKFLRDDYIQHNPNVDTGLKGFVQYFSKRGGFKEIPSTIPDLVSVQAEGNKVIFSIVDEHGSGAKKYTTTWFDMFRIQDKKIAEHWDCALKDND